MPHTKFLTLAFLLVFSCDALSWTCRDYGAEGKDSIGYHYSVASDILFGRIVAGTFDPTRDQTTEFELEIYKAYKGSKSGRVVLNTRHDAYFEDIVLGENYIFTLYGDNTINFCGYNHRVGRGVRSIERLRNIAEQENAILHETIKSFFEYIDYAV